MSLQYVNFQLFWAVVATLSINFLETTFLVIYMTETQHNLINLYTEEIYHDSRVLHINGSKNTVINSDRDLIIPETQKNMEGCTYDIQKKN